MLLRPALGSCSDDPAGRLPETEPGGDFEKRHRLRSIPVTRTELGPDGRTVTWHADDRINVYMLPEGSGSPVYAPYSIRAGSIGDDGRTALFEGGLSWQSPASTHTFYAYYAGAASGIELDGTTGHLLLPDISSQEQSGTESAHVGKANVMIAHPLTVTSPPKAKPPFSISHFPTSTRCSSSASRISAIPTPPQSRASRWKA